MLNLTSQFNGLLKRREAPAVHTPTFSVDQVNDFLQEAYRINSHIVTLHSELAKIRQSYLSTAQPRRTNLRSRTAQQQEEPLSDPQREEIDGNAKRLLRDLNASIRSLAEAEVLHQSTQQALIKKKHGSALAGLGSWAAGGTGRLGKTQEEVEAEEKLAQLGAHREGVLWFLRQNLQLCGRTQENMMTTRLTREVEKNRSILAKARLDAKLGAFPETSSFSEPTSPSRSQVSTHQSVAAVEEERQRINDLTDEQLQMFERDNQDMVKHYQSTLDKVRTAEQSLIEISELQSVLVENLEIQAVQVSQLVADSVNTTENVEKGNRELKKALDRPSTARYTFFAASGLCLFMIAWDFWI